MVSMLGKVIKTQGRIGVVVKESKIKPRQGVEAYHESAVQVIMQDNQERLALFLSNDDFNGPAVVWGHDIEILESSA